MVKATGSRYRKARRGKKSVTRDVKAKDVLYDSMLLFKTKAKYILGILEEKIKSSGKANYAELKILYQEMRKAEELSIDVAHKLAPYQSPKLESVEVKGSIEQRYVIRVPHQMKSTEDWMKATGATKASIEEVVDATKALKVPEYKDEDGDEDYIEPGMPQTNRTLQ